MRLISDLVFIVCIVPTRLFLIEALDLNSFGSKNDKSKDGQRNQLIIYDPHTGRQMSPVQYLPVFLGNKRQTVKPNNNLVNLPQLWNPCTCLDFLCMCCLGIRFGENFNNRICVAVQYNSDQIALQLRINYNKRTIAQFGFSARNPPSYCIPILLPLPIFACLRLYDIRAIGGNVQICLSVMLKVLMNTVFEFHFDCIRFGVNGVIVIRRGQIELEGTSVEEDDDEVILKGDTDTRQSVRLEDNYSGISVEGARKMGVPIVRGARRKTFTQ